MEEKLGKKEKVFQVIVYFCLALSLVSTISYMIYTILASSNILNQIISIISVVLLAIFSVFYVIVGMFAQNKKVKIFIIIGSLLLTFYSLFQVISSVNAKKDLVLDFTNKDIKEVVTWANERNILIEQDFENSDTILQYKIISQSVKAGTSTKGLKKMKVVVSDGVDTSISTIVTSMVGWKLDDVIKYIDDNHLTNVTINFEFSDTVSKDTIISQDVIKEVKRDEPITLVSSLGKEEDLKSVTMDNLVGLDTFHAIIYCGRNHLKCDIEYAYSEEKEENIILKQSVKKWEVISPSDNTEIILTVSKKNQITVPDLTKMNANEINTWATNNRLKIEFKEEHDDTIKKGKVVSSNYIKGNLINVGDTIQVTLSKGQIYMISFSNLDDFITWADGNDIAYQINYEYSNSIEKGKLISSSHKENQIIKNNETVILVISQGGNTIIPNLIGMTKEEASNNCKKANINCKFVDDSNEKNTKVIKQSMRSGSNVPSGTTVTLTLGE